MEILKENVLKNPDGKKKGVVSFFLQ